MNTIKEAIGKEKTIEQVEKLLDFLWPEDQLEKIEEVKRRKKK